MSKRSCAAAESIEDASLRMARVNGRRMRKAPRGSHCVGMEGCRFRDPTQAENPALQDSITIQFTRERRFMSKRSCEAAESIEDASLRMARVNGRRMCKAPRMTGALRKILQKCLRLGLALKTPLCYNIHSGQ